MCIYRVSPALTEEKYVPGPGGVGVVVIGPPRRVCWVAAVPVQLRVQVITAQVHFGRVEDPGLGAD